MRTVFRSPAVPALAVAAFLLALAALAGPRGAASAAADPQPPGKDNTPPAGFTALFNGKDLAGWKGLPVKEGLDNPIKRAQASPDVMRQAQAAADERMRQHWTVKDGMLVFDGKGDSLATARDDYGDFELLVDWKIEPKGDSGIYLRGSPQVQIWDTEFPDYFQHGADKGSGGLWNNAKHPRFPIKKADRPVGQWNTFWIKMVGEKVWVKLNGELVLDGVVMENLWDRSQPIFPTGQIELQNHGNTLYFKNIYVKELPRAK